MYVCIYIYIYIYTPAHSLQSELEINRKPKEEVVTLRKNPKQLKRRDRVERTTVFTRCVYCPLLCYLSFVFISSSGGTSLQLPGFLAPRLSGSLTPDPPNRQVSEPPAFWLSVSLALWLSVSLALWLSGSLALWLSGCLALWLPCIPDILNL